MARCGERAVAFRGASGRLAVLGRELLAAPEVDALPSRARCIRHRVRIRGHRRFTRTSLDGVRYSPETPIGSGRSLVACFHWAVAPSALTASPRRISP